MGFLTKILTALPLFILLLIFLSPTLTLANGGDQRLVDGGRYYINLSRAPFTPRVGVETSFLASFFDVRANRLIQEDLVIKVRISQLGGVGGKRTFIFEQDNIPVKGGVLELPYTFAESGLHEIFFDFVFASDPKKVYEAPDFLIDVQSKESRLNISWLVVGFMLSSIIGIVLGFVFGLGLGQRRA